MNKLLQLLLVFFWPYSTSGKDKVGQAVFALIIKIWLLSLC